VLSLAQVLQVVNYTFIRYSDRMLLIRCLLIMLISVKLINSFEDAGPMTLTYSVVEEQPAGTELGDLLVDTGLNTAVNRSLLKQIYFSVLPGKYK